MSFTITRNLERVVSYSMLCKLAEQKHVHITGSESNGLFSCRGVEGDYECEEDGIHGKFAGRGVTGDFSFEPGKAAVTIIEKPFWLPELLLKQKISAGLDAFCAELV